mmetsp:Transcript_35879/g.55073  ORF Transcript_35879/g.55073 Transcript_35879/m.55073 type:complete len:145 (-) Transcript_35879:73-507(-)
MAQQRREQIQSSKYYMSVEVALDDMDPRDKIAISRFIEIGDSMYTLMLMAAVGILTSKVHFWNKMNNFNNIGRIYRNTSFILGSARDRVGANILAYKRIFPYTSPSEAVYMPMQFFFFIVLGMKLRFNQRKDVFFQEAIERYEK